MLKTVYVIYKEDDNGYEIKAIDAIFDSYSKAVDYVVDELLNQYKDETREKQRKRADRYIHSFTVL